MIHTNNKLRRLGNQLLFTGPALFAFLAVVMIPFFYGIRLTFYKWDGISSAMPFVGIKNFIEVLHDDKFWTSILLTFKYVIAIVILINVIAFLLANLVTSGIKGQNFFRTIFFAPNLIGGLVLGFLWQYIFNSFLPTLGQKYHLLLFAKTWLGDEHLALWALVIASVWQYAGYMMVILIGGLLNIPKDVLEAARVDGVTRWSRLRYITLPLMVPSFIVTIFLSVQRGFMIYDVNYALTKGGPFESTVLGSMYVYNKAFIRFDYGVGQSEAFVLFFLVAAITLIQVGISKKKEVEA